MISTEEILTIHKTLIDSFGGSHGVRDFESLESALARPFQTYDNADLYQTSLDKAAAFNRKSFDKSSAGFSGHAMATVRTSTH